ncbi:MAG: FMN-binding domain protein [Treponematales bacterium]
MKRKIIIGTAVFAALMVLAVICFNAVDRGAKNAVEGITISVESADGLADGEYIGVYEIKPVKVVVQVNVESETITGIEILEHQRLLGGKAEKITGDVLGRQSLNVDAVTGATVSSKTILKAIENALQKGKVNNG